jgi:hypothetical protein
VSGILFLQPWLLLGALGATVPVLIHLFGRRRARRVRFPSLMLLRATQRRQRSLVRLRHWLVLLLRVLAVILLAMAMARPIVRVHAAWLPGGRDAAVAIVMDDSFSMAAAVKGETCFERAKAAAETILRRAGRRDPVLMLTSCADDASAKGRLSGEGGTAEDALRELAGMEASDGAAAVPGAIARAGEWLSRSPAASKHLYVLSDLQKCAWPARSLREGSGGADVDTTVVDVGTDGLANHLIESVEVVNEPLLVGRPARIRVGVREYGAQSPGGRLPVELVIDGAVLPAKSVSPARRAQGPGGTGEEFVEFAHTFRTAGAKRVMARTTADWLPVDDVRYATLRVRDPIRSLCIDAGVEADGKRAARFLVSALSPGGSDQPVAARAASASSLSAGVLQGTDVAVLADVPRLSSGQAAALAAFARDGGGVLIFLGERADSSFYSSVLVPALSGPGGGVKVGGRLGDPESKADYRVISDFLSSRPPLAPFAEASGGDLMSFHFYAVRDLQVGGEAATIAPLAHFDDGTLAMLEAHSGRGKTIVVNMAPAGGWNDAPMQSAFVPLVHRLTYYVAREGEAGLKDVVVGEEAGTALDGKAIVTDPMGVSAPAAGLRAGWAGFYTLAGRGADRSGVFAANVEPAESDLTRASRREVTALLKPIRAEVVTPRQLESRLAAGQARRVGLSGLFLVLAMAALASELLISALGRQRGDAGSMGDRADG